MRVVLDSNVVVSAFAAQGLCHLLFEHCLDRHELLLSEGLLGEVGKFFRGKTKLPADQITEILDFLRSEASVVRAQPLRADVCRDPDDVEVLGVALSGRADVMVTGDQDLLVLKEFRSIPIVSPRAFLFPRK